MSRRAAIILAGGKGERFQTQIQTWQDKALANLDGKPLLIHVIQNIEKLVDEIFVVVKDEKRKTKYFEIFSKYQFKNIQIIEDLKITNSSGPFVAILTGLKYTKAEYCITIPADMPLLNPKVAEYLFEEINQSYVIVPMWPNGKLETLLMILRRKFALEISSLLRHLNRNHPDDIIRGALRTMLISPLEKIKELDSKLCSFVNINSPEDLNELQPRHGKGTAESVRLDLGKIPIIELKKLAHASSIRDASNFLEATKIFDEAATKLEGKKIFFWAALSREHEAKTLLSFSEPSNKGEFSKRSKEAFLKAAQNYKLESLIYEEKKCFRLADRAKADGIWCEERAKNL